jgi:hypothetical protein
MHMAKMAVQYKILNLTKVHIESILHFTDCEIGSGYFSKADLVPFYEDPILSAASFVLADRDAIHGLRLSYGPGSPLTLQKLTIHDQGKWLFPLDQIGYFQSLFLSSAVRGKGLGQELSRISMDAIRKQGGKAIVCHSWDESPGNSSRKYLDKMLFVPVRKIEKFWFQIQYECTRCGFPCVCTATEMICDLEKAFKHSHNEIGVQT